jgi:hypothetical protein
VPACFERTEPGRWVVRDAAGTEVGFVDRQAGAFLVINTTAATTVTTASFAEALAWLLVQAPKL